MRNGKRSPAWRATAPPWENPARTMRSAAMPRATCSSTSARATPADARTPSMSARRSSSGPAMSYHARISMPPLMVTGRTGAWGNTYRTPSSPPFSSSAATGSKSCPSAPRPCSHTTAAVAGFAGSTTTGTSSPASSIVLTGGIPPDRSRSASPGSRTALPRTGPGGLRRARRAALLRAGSRESRLAHGRRSHGPDPASPTVLTHGSPAPGPAGVSVPAGRAANRAAHRRRPGSGPALADGRAGAARGGADRPSDRGPPPRPGWTGR